MAWFLDEDRGKTEADYLNEGFPPKVARYMSQNPPEPPQLYPATGRALDLYALLQTQWHCGMGGRTGLIYAEAFAMMDRLEIPKDAQLPLFQDLQVMEREALSIWAARARR